MINLQKKGIFLPSLYKVFQCRLASESTDLKSILANKIPIEREKVRNFRKKHGNTKIGDVTVDMMYGGMRGLKAMVWETSVLDPNEGIRFRDYSIPDLKLKLPKIPGGHEPQPEGMFWLLLTGDLPTKAQVDWLSKEWAKRAELPPHVVTLLNNLPSQKVHPMTQLIAAVAACNTESRFAEVYHKGVKKTQYWDYTYEDSMDLLAKLPSMAAVIYRNSYRDGKVSTVMPNKDWTENFTHLLGYNSAEFTDLMRLFLTIHSDHEGGNVSAHTGHLVGSALSDVYLSFSASMAGLAGPLHGLANQESLIFLMELKSALGDTPTDDKVKEYILNTLKAGKVIPGFGHAVLRKIDPRYTCFTDFAQRHLADDLNFKIMVQLMKIVPPILQATGKVKNPWPNVDAASGVLLRHYGMKEMSYYTVCFGISRALGVLASLIWSRAHGLPIERPKSFSTDYLIKMLG